MIGRLAVEHALATGIVGGIEAARQLLEVAAGPALDGPLPYRFASVRPPFLEPDRSPSFSTTV